MASATNDLYFRAQALIAGECIEAETVQGRLIHLVVETVSTMTLSKLGKVLAIAGYSPDTLESQTIVIHRELKHRVIKQIQIVVAVKS